MALQVTPCGNAAQTQGNARRHGAYRYCPLGARVATVTTRSRPFVNAADLHPGQHRLLTLLEKLRLQVLALPPFGCDTCLVGDAFLSQSVNRFVGACTCLEVPECRQ